MRTVTATVAVALLAAAASASAAAAPSGSVVLPNFADGPGLGFLFSEMSAGNAGLAEASSWGCGSSTIGGSGNISYIYAYGCTVTSEQVLAMAALPDFEFSSDKSVTMRNGTAHGLLLANLWPLVMHFQSDSDAASYAAVANASVGCEAALTAPAELTVGCSGGESCEGCVLADFFELSSPFKATFGAQQPRGGSGRARPGGVRLE